LWLVFGMLNALRNQRRKERQEKEQRHIAPAPEAVEQIARTEQKKLMPVGPRFQRPRNRQHDEEEDSVFNGWEKHARALRRKEMMAPAYGVGRCEGIEKLTSSAPQNRGWVKQTVARNAVCPESFSLQYLLRQLCSVPRPLLAQCESRSLYTSIVLVPGSCT